MNIPGLRPLFIPLNKHGSTSRQAAMAVKEAYESNDQILIFPSGYAPRKIKGKILDLEWQKHFVAIPFGKNRVDLLDFHGICGFRMEKDFDSRFSRYFFACNEPDLLPYNGPMLRDINNNLATNEFNKKIQYYADTADLC